MQPHICNGSLMHGSHGLLDYMQTYRLNHGETDGNDQNDSVKMANSLSPYTDGIDNEFFKINGGKLTIAFRKKVVVSGLYIKGGQSNFIEEFQLAFQYDDDYISNVTNTNEYNYSPWYYSEDTELHQTRFKSGETNAKYLYVRPHAADRVILQVVKHTKEPRIKLDILGCVYDNSTEKDTETQTLDTCFLYRPDTLLANQPILDNFLDALKQNSQEKSKGPNYYYFHIYNLTKKFLLLTTKEEPFARSLDPDMECRPPCDFIAQVFNALNQEETCNEADVTSFLEDKLISVRNGSVNNCVEDGLVRYEAQM
ncbi:uncharacterized protein LOC143033705 [Oratosquilla oratoria]|uniref:uncharacterized protein LOC143033705 n=1 Tax=Oratosquilla oratoria TaxID=337810 RepID=UPI003F75FAEC